MPRPRISPDQVDFIMKMMAVEYSNSEIARKLGVTEDAIRYRVKRALLGKEDGRRLKPSSVESYRAVIDQWGKDYEEDRAGRHSRRSANG